MFSDDELEFLDKLHEAVPGLSHDALRIFWLTFQREAIRRIAVERKSLDLGFVKLFPMPYRQNWKEAVAVRFKDRIFRVFRSSNTNMPRNLRAFGFYEALASPKLLAIDRKRGFIRWSVECVPATRLTNRMDDHEYALKERLGPAEYAAGFLKELMSRLLVAQKLMRWYLSRVAIPPGRILPDGVFETSTCVWVKPGNGICKVMRLSAEEAFSEWRDEEDDGANPNPAPVTWPAPSKVSQAETGTQSPESNRNSQFPETVWDQYQQEEPADIAASSG